MAHGREGPDIVMTIRYATASDVKAVTDHELNRTPDGSSAIDPARSPLNMVLHGPESQQAALSKMRADGVKGPAAQAEAPYVQMVLSASPSYFRPNGEGPGEWDDSALDIWRDVTMEWLEREYGADLAHVSMHLDEDTPHMHVLIVPTYEKSARRPGKQKNDETDENFAARVKAAEDRPKIRTIGRSSNVYWSKNWARMNARKSYYAETDRQGLGLGYGRDFVGEGMPSPENAPTGKWVREKAADLAIKEAKLETDRTSAKSQAVDVMRNAQTKAEKVLTDAKAMAEAEANTIINEAKTRAERVTKKAVAVLSATEALIEEIQAGTIGVSPEGKLVARNVEALMAGFPETKAAVIASAQAAERIRRKEARIDKLTKKLSAAWDVVTTIFRRADMPLDARIQGEDALRGVEKEVGKRVPLPSLPGLKWSRPAKKPVEPSGPIGPEV